MGSGEGEAVATWPLAAAAASDVVAAAAALGAEAAAAALGAAAEAAAEEGVTGEAAVLVEGTQPLRKLLLRRRTCWQAAVAAALETAELGQVRVSYQLSLKRLILSKEKASLELRFLPTIFMDS